MLLALTGHIRATATNGAKLQWHGMSNYMHVIMHIIICKNDAHMHFPGGTSLRVMDCCKSEMQMCKYKTQEAVS